MDIIRRLTIMHSAAYVARARDWATTLEDSAAREAGAPLKDVRQAVAREVGVSPGTMENLRNGRLKGIAVHIYDRLQAAMVRRLETQLRRIEHEIHLLKAQGAHPGSGAMAAALADRVAVRRALGLETEPVTTAEVGGRDG